VPEKSFLDCAADYSFKLLEHFDRDVSKLDVPQQTLITLHSVQGVVDNGGFQYLFESDFPANPPYSKFVEAYRRIGAGHAAECLEKAVAMFPFEDPHLHQEQRVEFMETLEEDSEFVQLGDEVCGDGEIWAALEAYARANAASFPVSAK
jgi:hypothetical protein